jgi:very-short-patch-repair endonuclease
MHITIQRDHARALRRTPTQAERKLRGALRKRTLHGHRFQRQVEIGPYIVDFLCRKQNLIIEVDGPTHANPQAIDYDYRRDTYLSTKGYRVLRVHNHDILQNMEQVLDTLIRLLPPKQS